MNVINSEIMPEGDNERNQLPSFQTRISEISDARNAALEKIEEASSVLERAYELSAEAKTFAQRAHDGVQFHDYDRRETKSYKALFKSQFDRAASVETFRRQLDAQIWMHLMDLSGMRDMMDATASREFDNDLRGDVTPATTENLRATFQTLMGQADVIFARGLATAFSNLDRRFKSHDGFKIGSRIIITRAFSDFSGAFSPSGYRRETIIDVERVMAKLDGKLPQGSAFIEAIDRDRPGYGPRQSEHVSDYFKVRGFQNGNAHLWFTRDDLVDKANKILADYYGEVLPDAVMRGEDAAEFVKRTNLPAKDLQFFYSPKPVVESLLDKLCLEEGSNILEPSAGEGHIVRGLKDAGYNVTAIEIMPDRVRKLRELEDDQCDVYARNFLDLDAIESFDAAVLNPPYYKIHWAEHVRHAWDFIRPGGQLVAVLPVTAEIGESKAHQSFRRWAEKVNSGWGGLWSDLPEESFLECGTRVNTVILSMKKPMA